VLRLALRNIFRHRLRTGLTLAAIVFGVIGLVLSGGFIEDVLVQLREATIHSRLGHIQVFREGYNEAGLQEPYRYLIEEPQAPMREITAVPHVVDVLARLNFSGLANTGRADLPIIGEGVEPDKEARFGSALTIVSGRQLSDADSFGVLLGEGVASALQLAPGDFLTLMVSTPEGALNTLDFEIVGVFRSFSKDFDDRAVRIPLAAAQELLYTQGVHSLVIALDETRHTDEVAAALSRTLPGLGLELRTWEQLADFYRNTAQLYKRQFGVLQLIVLVLVLLGVSNSVNMAINERTGEFGTILAIGHRPRQVFRQVLVENVLLGLLGAAIGIVLAVLIALTISRIGIAMPPPPGSSVGYMAQIRVVPGVIAAAGAIAAVATVLAALRPARRVSRMMIVDALRQNI
jgi:putative ABC transport system permease protein